MSTITLPNIRVSSDLTVKVRLKDSGVAIDWSTLNNVKASIYSDAQRALAGRCDVSIDAEDPTLLVCQYAANKPQYVGVNRIVVSAKYHGETKTYDKPAFTFVRWTADQEGEQITIDDPDVDVEISVEDISSSILQEAVDAAFEAADRANDAAAAAEHMVDIHTGPEGKSAYEVAVEEGYTGTEEEWLASLVGPQGQQGIQGETGAAAGFGTVSVSLQEDGGQPSATVAASGADTAKNFAFTFNNLKGDKGDKGDQGNSGYTGAAGELEVVNNLTDGGAAKALSAEMGKTLEGEVSQLEAKVTGVVEKNLTFENGWINTTGAVASSSVSIFSQPFLLKAGEKVTVGTANSNICIIGTTNADSLSVGDTITVLQRTYSNNFETYEYTAEQDIKIVICVKASNYVLSFYDTLSITEEISNLATKDELAGVEAEVREVFGTDNGTEYFNSQSFTTEKYLNPAQKRLLPTSSTSMGVMYIQVKAGDVVIARLATSSTIAPIAFSTNNNTDYGFVIGCLYNDYYDSTTTPKTYRYDVVEDGYVLICTTDVSASNSSVIIYHAGKFGKYASESQLKQLAFSIDNADPFKYGKNIFNPSKLLPGYNYIAADGVVTTDSQQARRVFDYIAIEPGITYTLSADVAVELTPFYYNKDLAYLGAGATTVSAIATASGAQLVTPPDAHYVRFVWYVSRQLVRPMLEKANTKGEYEAYKYEIPFLADAERIKTQHRVLLLNLEGDINTNRIEEDLFRCGFLCGVCSFETFVNEHKTFMADYDAIIVCQMIVDYTSTLSLTDIYNALYEYKDSKRIIFLAAPYASTAKNLGFKRYSYVGRPADPSQSANYQSIVPFFDENFTITYEQITNPNLAISANGNYDLIHPGLSMVGGVQALVGLSDGSSSVEYPVKVEYNNSTYYPAFIKGNIAVIFDCGSYYGNSELSPGWKYIDYAKMLMYMFGIDKRDRLAMDSAFGKRVAGIGIDGDLTTDLTASKDLISPIAGDYVLEFGFVAGFLNEAMADKYRYIRSKFPKLEYASHTFSHYNPTYRKTITDEEHIIDSKGFVVLDCDSMVQVSSVSDGTNTYTILRSQSLRTVQPAAGECAVYENQYGNSDGKIKFNIGKVGESVFVTYTYLDDAKESFGSIKALESLGVMTDKCVYLTIGGDSVNGVSYEMCDNAGICLCDYTGFPTYRDAFIAKRMNKPIPPILAVTMFGNGYMVAMTDANITRRNGAQEFQTIEMPNCVAYCKTKELPYITYIHDFIISTTAPNGVWLDPTRAAYKQATAAETVAYLQEELYRFMFDYISQHDSVLWTTRGAAAKMYHTLNKYLHYDIRRDGNRVYIYAKNTSLETIKGVTFKLPVDIANYSLNYCEIVSPNKSSVQKRYDSTTNELVIWLDVCPGDTEVVIDIIA